MHYPKALQCGILMTVMFVTSGCQRLNNWLTGNFSAKPLASVDTIAALEQRYADLNQTAENIEKVSVTNAPMAASQRNRVINDLLRISDYHYQRFKESAFVNNAGFNTGFDLLSIGLSSSATLVGGPAAQALSATDTGLKAAQGKISERWLAGRTMPALVATMDSMRAEVATILFERMILEYEKFQIDEGIRLVATYHQKASIIDAMNQMSAVASASKQTNEAKANAAKQKPRQF